MFPSQPAGDRQGNAVPGIAARNAAAWRRRETTVTERTIQQVARIRPFLLRCPDPA
jgi:hypothetical protein